MGGIMFIIGIVLAILICVPPITPLNASRKSR